ncbi:MAG: DNA cytosine methyltransferase [Rhodospirillales bacterium]|nr:DNA cytosine methyltransferase [Rhodospirillales bacterium]
MTGTGGERFSAIDLFAGCGGLSLGLRAAGFDVVAAVEKECVAASTYAKNHPAARLIERDIQAVDPRALMHELAMSPGDLDLLAGCPPCQGFSTLRTYNGNKSIFDPQNDLIFQMLGFVRRFRPKALMIENVPSLLGDRRLVEFRSELEALGYGSRAKVFNARDFGVPQRRRRMVLLGWSGESIPFAGPCSWAPTVADALRGVSTAGQSGDPAHDYRVRRSNRIEALIRLVPKNGGSRCDLPDEYRLDCHRRTDGFRDVYGRMTWQDPAPTITSGCINPSRGRFLHPDEPRAITLREAALLQGFPRRYEFELSRGRYAVAHLIGNAFPPAFAERHARSIAKHLSLRRRTP